MNVRDAVRLLTEVANQSSSPDEREAIAARGGLPVYSDMGGVLVVLDDASVLEYSPETGTVRSPEELWRVLALAQAARKHPSLAALMPVKPEFVRCVSCVLRYGFHLRGTLRCLP
jgi:hypothetical protein